MHTNSDNPPRGETMRKGSTVSSIGLSTTWRLSIIERANGKTRAGVQHIKFFKNRRSGGFAPLGPQTTQSGYDREQTRSPRLDCHAMLSVNAQRTPGVARATGCEGKDAEGRSHLAHTAGDHPPQGDEAATQNRVEHKTVRRMDGGEG